MGLALSYLAPGPCAAVRCREVAYEAVAVGWRHLILDVCLAGGQQTDLLRDL